MDTSLWPAALFGFVFVLLGVLRLARSPFELGWGVALAVGMALAVVFLSPAVLVPVGLGVVGAGWWREDGAFSKKRRPAPVERMWNPAPGTGAAGRLFEQVVDGLGQGSAQAHARGLVPWTPHTGDAQEDAQSLAVRARRSNPFRPEGALGLRTGLAMHHPGRVEKGLEADAFLVSGDPDTPDAGADGGDAPVDQVAVGAHGTSAEGTP